MTDAHIANQGLSPCIEFTFEETGFAPIENNVWFTSAVASHYDNRCWSMWKLPMFGCTNASHVPHVVAECRKAYHPWYLRLAIFDSMRQVHVIPLSLPAPMPVPVPAQVPAPRPVPA